VLLGAGRPGVRPPAVTDLALAARPAVRRFVLGEDVLIECAMA